MMAIEPRQDEKTASDDVAQRALLAFRSWQEHTVVQRMQKTGLGDPAFFFDDNAMHHRDCPAGPPKLRQATRRQSQKASPSPTPCVGIEGLRWKVEI